jgi:hypothetical protein
MFWLLSPQGKSLQCLLSRSRLGGAEPGAQPVSNDETVKELC